MKIIISGHKHNISYKMPAKFKRYNCNEVINKVLCVNEVVRLIHICDVACTV